MRKWKEGKRSIFVAVAGLKRVLVYPLEQVLMPDWMQLHKNRCVVTVTEALLQHGHIFGGGTSEVLKC